MLTFGTGIGSGLFLDGSCVPNTELGHLYLDGEEAEHRAAAIVRDREKLSWKEWGSRVDRYLEHVVFLFSPDLFIVGGGVSRKADKWLPYVKIDVEIVAADARERGRHRRRRARSPSRPSAAETHRATAQRASETEPVAQTTTSRRRALTALIRPDARRWAVLGALIAAASAGSLAGPLIVRRIVDEARHGTTAAEVVRLGVLFLVVAVLTQVLNVVVVASATRAAWRITNGLRLDITRHVLGLDHEFHRKHTPGELIQRVDGDVTNVSDFLSQVVPKVVGAAILLVRHARRAHRRSTGASASAWLVYLVGSVALVISMRHRAVRESSDEMGAYARLYGGIEERLTAVEDLRANGAETHADVAVRRGQHRGDRQRRAARGGVPAHVVGAADRRRRRARRYARAARRSS